MSYLLNVSFVFDEKIESNFVIWLKNNIVFEDHSLFRMIGTKDDNITYCSQITVNSITEVQQKTSELHSKIHTALKNDFNEEVIFFMSALESI